MLMLRDFSSYRSTFVVLLTTLLGIIATFLVLPSLTYAQGPLLTQRDGLPSNGITALSGQDDTLWVGTIAGLGKWQAGQVKTIELPLDEHHVLALHDHEGALWVGTADGVARLAQERWQMWQRGADGLRSDWVTSFTTHQNRMLIGTYGGGVQEWTGDEWLSVGSNGPWQVKKLATDGQDLWAGTPRGVWRWDNVAWQQESLPVDRLNVTDLHVAEGKLWLASDKGLFWKAHHTTEWKQTVLTTAVTAMTELADGRMMVATQQALVLLNETDEQLIPLNRYVSTLLATEKGLFVGTLGKGLIITALTGMPARLTPSPSPNNGRGQFLRSSPLPWLGEGLGVRRAGMPVRARPVVLLHGLGDSNNLRDSNLRFLARWLQKDGHVVRLAPYDDQASLLENAQAVRDTIAALKEETGQSEVILIAHSLGGWVARTYLATGATDIAGLITLGTPHGGVRMAYERLVTQLASHETPNIRELLPEHVTLIAPFAERADIPQLHIGGTLLPKGNLFMGFPAHDGIISAASATYAPGATRVYPLLHGWSVPTLQFGIPSFLWPDNLYRNTLRAWIQDLSLESASGSESASFAWQTRAPAQSLPEAGFTQRPLLAQALAPQERVKIDVTLDGQPATWFLEGRGISMDVLAPDSTFYAHNRLLLGNQVAHLPYRGAQQLFQPFDLWSTRNQPGVWEVTLTNQSQEPVATRLSLVQPGQPSLSISLSEAWVAAGEAVTIEVQGQPNQTLVALLLDQSVALLETSPGSYRATINAPQKAGYHALRVVGQQVERWAVVGVYSDAWSVKGVEATSEKDRVTLNLTIEGEGKLALGLQLLKKDQVVATRLIGPLEWSQMGQHTVVEEIKNPTGSADVRLEWKLFDAAGALVPVRR